jgi:hypothetical protein
MESGLVRISVADRRSRRGCHDAPSPRPAPTAPTPARPERLEDPVIGGDRIAQQGGVAIALQHLHHVIGAAARSLQGKSDPIDAIAAAKTALAGERTGTPKRRDGPIEARATSRVSVVTPGSSTLLVRSQAIPSVNMLFLPPPVFHARASTHAVNSASTAEKSRTP